MTPSPDYIRGQRYAFKRAAEIADARCAELEAQGSKHPDNSRSREACAQGAYEAMWLAKAIRAEAAKLPKAIWPRKEPRDA